MLIISSAFYFIISNPFFQPLKTQLLQFTLAVFILLLVINISKNKIIFASTSLFLVILSFFISSRPSQAGTIANIRDQLDSAQLSYFGRLDNNNTAGNSIITVKTATGDAPSNNNYNLFIGDTLAIANATSGSTQYIVSDIAGTNSISLSTAIDNLNVFDGAYVVATRSAVHRVSFSPPSNETSGKWQVLLKATSLSGEDPSDGMPDQGGFDALGLLSSDITCPWGATASVGTTVVLTSGISVGTTGPYHLITCTLPVGGTNPFGTGETGTIIIGDVNKLINPSPAINHTTGQADAGADTYSFFIRHTKSDDSIINGETSIGKIALTESVLVTATIDPTITFYIDAIGTSVPGFNRCGATLSGGANNTTATSVNFGSISLGQFNTLAQRFTCSTNALSGYVVQVFESAPLTTINIGSTSFIPDTTCDSGCTIDTPGLWATEVSSSQFGYSLEDILGSPVAFTYGDMGDFNSKPFGVGYNNARPIMSYTSTPATEDQAYICYRITASNFQEAGTYQNQINFIATATF